jgi:translation elongation factor EF-4
MNEATLIDNTRKRKLLEKQKEGKRPVPGSARSISRRRRSSPR